MNPLLPLALSVGVFAASWWLTGRFRRYALARRLVDVPNPRSSHSVATPRGGGAAIVLTTIGALFLIGALGWLGWHDLWGLLCGGAAVAAVGFADDHGRLSRGWRLLAHFAAAGSVLASVGRLPPLPVLGTTFDAGWLGYPIAALYIVWLINLTNFMDGIDGLAGTEALIVSLGGALVYVVALPGANSWIAPITLASATLGFLIWNWPPAKIFMGDAGSGFLGLMLAALSLQAGQTAPELVWSWLILLAVFVIDATITLIRRLARRERIWEAHRTHAYQHAAQTWGAHRPVTIAVAAINLLWLLPLAVLVARHALDGLIGALIAYAPLVAAAVWLGAGAPKRLSNEMYAPNV